MRKLISKIQNIFKAIFSRSFMLIINHENSSECRIHVMSNLDQVHCLIALTKNLEEDSSLRELLIGLYEERINRINALNSIEKEVVRKPGSDNL
jgi:histidyl-tRNA synthetase